MLELSTEELIIFVSVAVLYLLAAIVGIFQLSNGGEKYRRFLLLLVSLAVCLEAILLIFRAIAIKSVPITGLFESMIVLIIVFGVMFLLFSIAVRQVWFSSLMVWIILIMVFLAGLVAKPASQPHPIATTPWAIAHGIAMVLSGVLIIFATSNAFLYLLGTNRLKQKKVMKVLGKVPNLEKLKRLNVFGLKSCFVLITIGLASGFGLAMWKSATIQMSILDWLMDAKIVLIIISWLLLTLVLTLHSLVVLKDKTIAYVTIILFFVILFAIVGTSVFCSTKHDFTTNNVKLDQGSKYVNEYYSCRI